MPKNQAELAGTQVDKIPPLEDAVSEWRALVDERMGLTSREVECREKVEDLLRKHDLEDAGYPYQDGERAFKVKMSRGKEKAVFERMAE